MDWVKAKNIIIIGLIISNVFLFYNYSGGFENTSEDYTESTLEYLESHNVFVDLDNMDFEDEMPFLEVEFVDIRNSLTPIFDFHDGYEDDFLKDENNQFIYNIDSEISIITRSDFLSDKNINYIRENDLKEDEENLIKLGNDFLSSDLFSDYNFKPYLMDSRNILLDGREQTINILEYRQVYNQNNLDSSHIRLFFLGEDIIQANMKIINIIDIGDTLYTLGSIDQVLLRSLGEIRKGLDKDKVVTIVDIDISYNFLIPDNKGGVLESGTAYPVWKIYLDNQEVITIDAI